jgi:hypothetical protein
VATYRYAVAACKFVSAGRVGLGFIVRTFSLVGVVEDVEAVVINVVASKDIGDESQGRGLSNASLSNKKDGVSRCLVLCRLDDSLTERLYIAE